MVSKIWIEFVTPRFSYGEVEAALGEVFGLDAKTTRGPLRGRLKRFQTLGLPERKPGKGARVFYSSEQAAQWLIALKLSELGWDPIVIASVIREYWDSEIAPAIQVNITVIPTGYPLKLILRPQLMRDAWFPQKRRWISVQRRDESYDTPILVDESDTPISAVPTAPTIHDPTPLPQSWRRSLLVPDVDHDPDEWVCLLDVSHLLGRLQEALERA
jgi:hypothetical protein